jgi:Ca-activated chloride channel family protein
VAETAEGSSMEITHRLQLSALALILAASGNPVMTASAAGESVTLKTSVDRPLLVKSERGAPVVVKIEVEGCVAPKKARAPLNLAIVLDRSGSMSGAKLEQAKQAASLLVDQLDPDDIISLIAYESGIEVVVPAARLGDRAPEIRRLIGRIETGGSTALYGGVEEGSRQLREFLSKERINRVLLLSDGIANVGPSDNRSIADLGKRIAAEGMSVTTIGLGSDYNETLMTALAEASDANYYHIADVETLPEVFKKELGELQTIVAREVIIEIRCPEGVRPIRFLGRPGELKSQTERVAFATVSGGQKRELYLECLVGGGAFGRVNEIASVALRHDGSAADQIAPVVVGYTEDTTLAEKTTDRGIRAEAAIFENAVATEEAIALADQGNAAASRSVLDTQIAKLKAAQAAAPAPQQAAISLELEGISKAREELESDQLSKEQRKVLSNGAWQTRNSKR